MKTILITGCSSGFGLEIARVFLQRDWRVIATMRHPDQTLLPKSANLTLLPLDVTSAPSIRLCLDAAGPIDVLVNNAGVGLMAPLEGTSMESARQLFETNTLGTFAVTQAVIPQFRERNAGTIVNVTSMVTWRPLPLLSVYSASKAAVEAFTTSLALELQQFNVRACLVLPGRAPDTRFGDNARALMGGATPAAYEAFVQRCFAGMTSDGELTQAEEVAEAVWEVVNNPDAPMRTPAGADAVKMAAQ